MLGREKKVEILGVPFNNIPKEDFEAVLLNLFNRPTISRAVILNFRSFMKERRAIRRGKSSICKDADIVLTTSKMVAWAGKSLYGVESIRFYPFSLVIHLLGLLEKRSFSAYFVGGNSSEIQKLFGNIKSSFPGLKIVGRYKGDYHKSEEVAVLTGIKKAGPTFLLAGSRLKQGDRWLMNASKNIGKGLLLSSPETFKIMCGKKKPQSETLWLKQGHCSVSSYFLPWRWFSWVRYLFFMITVLVEKRKKSQNRP